MSTFDLELCKNSEELSKPFRYICQQRDARKKKDKKYQKKSKIGFEPHKLDYEKFISFLPETPEFTKIDLQDLDKKSKNIFQSPTEKVSGIDRKISSELENIE